MKRSSVRPDPVGSIGTRSDEIAPGRSTLTQHLAPRSASAGAFGLPSGAREIELSGDAPAAPLDQLSRWTAAAFGDLNAMPVQRHAIDLERIAAPSLELATTPRRDLPSDGSGQAMPRDVQAKMERAFATDFSAVRVHEGPRSAALGAHAYTQGSEIHFAPGQYRPEGEPGQALLGHELAHVVQQAQGRVSATTQAKGVGINDDSALEREADDLGARAARGEIVARADTPPIDRDARPAVTQQQRAPIQRLIDLKIDDEEFIHTKQTAERPPGCLPQGSQGDHTTPYTSLQDQVANAIEGVTLADAWVNLMDTFTVYTTLPGWAESKKFTTGMVAPYVHGLLTTKGDIDALQLAVTQMLVLRNQIALTSLPKGGHGNGEGKWAGSLQYQERQFQLGHAPDLKAVQVMDYIWKAFDHGRVSALADDKRAAIVEQHALTMADAYPQLCGAVGVTAADLVAHYPKRDWATFDPG